MDAPNPALRKQLQDAEQEKPVDLVFILRGGATDVYTLISNLRALQQRIPHNHISDTHPYILADSAGAYPAAGLVGPNPVDPLDLPGRFQKNIASYLSRDRHEAEQALEADVGNLLIRETVIPVTISTMDITEAFRPAYFTNFPERYGTARPGFKSPANQNDDVKLTQATLASSAFPLILGDYRIGERRFMDMAFLETHTTNLLSYKLAHEKTNPERRLVCVIFGNNYSDFKLSSDEDLRLAYLKHHFSAAVRARAQSDLVNFTHALFGEDNVFDLSLYVEQPFLSRSVGPASDAFRHDELAIRERVLWTEAQFKNNQGHTQTLNRLAEVIRRGSLSQASIAPASTRRVIEVGPEVIEYSALTAREKFISRARNVAPGLTLAGEALAETMTPVLTKARPVVAAGATVLMAGMAQAGTWLGQQWQDKAAPAIQDMGYFLMNGEHASRAHARDLARQPSQSHLSEQHTPSEFEHKLP